MKLSILRQAFLTALEIGGQVCAATPLPVTKLVKIKLDNGKIMVTSTNISMFVSKRVDIEYTGEPMEFCIDPKNIQPVLKTVKDPMVDLEIDDKHVVLKHQKGEIEIPVFSAESFPMPKIVGEARSISMDASFFVDSIKRAAKFADKGKGLDRPALRTIYCYLNGDDLKITATDGHALYMTKTEYTGDKSQLQDEGIMIPTQAVPVLTSIIPMDGEIVIKDRERNFSISVDGCSVFVTKVEEKYPPVERIIPAHTTHTSVPAKEFYEAINRCALMANKVSMSITLSIDGNMMDIRGEDIDCQTKSKEFLLTEGELDGLKVCLSAAFLSTIIREIEAETIDIYAESESRPVVFKARDNENTLFLLMPIKPTV